MGEVVFRPLNRRDFALLGRWLAEPHVARWWRDLATPEDIEARYGPRVDGTDATEMWVATADGHPFGLIERYLVADHADWAAAVTATGVDEAGAGIDYLIGEPASVGRGLGTQMIAAFSDLTFERYAEAQVIVAAPQRANVASWRALERAGYVRRWSGTLDSDDPSDDGPAHMYALLRPRR